MVSFVTLCWAVDTEFFGIFVHSNPESLSSFMLVLMTDTISKPVLRDFSNQSKTRKVFCRQPNKVVPFVRMRKK